MARSEYIYVAFFCDDLIGAWTVKYEMERYLEDRDITCVWRIRQSDMSITNMSDDYCLA